MRPLRSWQMSDRMLLSDWINTTEAQHTERICIQNSYCELIMVRRQSSWEEIVERHRIGDMRVIWCAVAPGAGTGAGTGTGTISESGIPVAERRRAVADYCARLGITRAELAHRAMVHDRDLRRWQGGGIPDHSVKAQRITAVLRRVTHI